MISLEKACYSVQGHTLLSETSLQFSTGEFWAVAGPNGAGKSTLLKLLSAEYLPTKGRVRFQGRDTHDYRPAELARLRAVLAQHNPVSLDFSVTEIVLMGRYPYYGHRPSDKDLFIVNQCLEWVEMGAYAQRSYPTLSGGEQQRIQFARALAQIWETKNGFLFLDEPTTGMDLKHQYQTFQLAASLARQGFGVVAVVHDLNLALQYTDQTVLLKKGRIMASGKTNHTLHEESLQATFELPIHLIPADHIRKNATIVPVPI
ncbi:iron complex transport system ATP-binding protein [Dyadobacter jejuensis]|uniref:Iron complex transport system ATP-binding protein n=1 Tax=Dyadobacter jejuensis TaxID=1082580 RepID=A0A316AGI3_9BACT|nr:heme ABC transporter ATP-binding protein [Dyadobacter jejuensis]PWJ56702.1 iron complex transport system ATP-binding protein [Dyadobacter jejuensis]